MSFTFEDAKFEPFVEMEGSSVSSPSKIWKCPLCNKPFTSKNAMYDHMYAKHADEIPEGMSAAQFAFNIRNKKSFGLCRECKVNKTQWDETAERYKTFCSKECAAKYAAEAKRRMVAKYGTEHLLNDPEHQQKMMDNRSISGKYRFMTDGVEVPYMGSYELDFLRHMDLMMGLDGEEVMRCPESFSYVQDGTKRLYIPDYYLPNFNLIVEIKDGGDNPNKHPHRQGSDMEKETLKDQVMKDQNEYHFVKVIDKKYSLFVLAIKMIVDTAWDDPEFKKKYDKIILIPNEAA